MKYADVRVHHTPETRHPMHDFEIRHDDIERASLVYWNTVFDETNTMVFRVRGDPEPFRAKLDARDATLAYSHTPAVEGVFYCCVRDRVTDADEGYIEAFARGTLVVVPPVEFNPDGTTDLTLVGTAEDVASAVEELPDGLQATVRAIGPYRRKVESRPALTDRQREAVAAAVACGYYESPRTGSVEDVAAALGVSVGTAAEHLRKAEAAVMGSQ